jgi:hypothetical protein
MAIIDLSNTNTYPLVKRVALSTAAQQITLPRDCTQITFTAEVDMYWANDGDDGDAFGGSGILEYVPLTQNLVQTVKMEIGRQSNRTLLVAAQTGTAAVSIIIEKDK